MQSVTGVTRAAMAANAHLTREAGRCTVDDISNQSTGYCPDVSSWQAVARALDHTGLGRPSRFTHDY